MPPVASILLDAVLKSTVVLSLAWIAGLLLKNHSAASRHLMRAIALTACMLLPLLSLLLPAWHVRGWPQYVSSSEPPLNAGQSAAAVRSHQPPPRAGIPAKIRATESAARPPAQIRPDYGAARPASSAPKASESRTSAEGRKAFIGQNFDWRLLLGFGWLLGAAIFVVRALIAEIRLRRLLRNATPLQDPGWSARLHSLACSVGIRRPVALLTSQETEVPLTAGMLRPKVVLSPDFEEWRPLRGDAVLRHELAHIKRMDAITHGLANLAIAVYWFHPLVWKTVTAMRAEGERACDDYVLAAGTRASEYAHELLEIAASLRQPDYTAALGMARRSELEGRVMAILNPAMRRGSISRNTVFAVITLMLALTLPLAAMRPLPPQNATGPAKVQKPSPATPVTPAAPPGPAMKLPTPPAPPAPGQSVAIPEEPADPPEVEAPEVEAPPAVVAPEMVEVDALALSRAERDVEAAESELKSAGAEIASEASRTDLSQEQLDQERRQLEELKAEIAALHQEIRALRSQHLPALAGSRDAMNEYQAAMKAYQVQAGALRGRFAAGFNDKDMLEKLHGQLAALAEQQEVMKDMRRNWLQESTAMQALSQQAALKALQQSAEMRSFAVAGSGRGLKAHLAQRAAALGNECLTAKGSSRSLQLRSENNHKNWSMSWTGESCTASVHAEGEFVFTHEGTEIQSLSPGGFIEIRERKGDTSRHLKVTSSSGGLNYALTVNGKQQPFDESAKKWLASYLLAFDEGWENF